jgi:mutator protein MutT
MADCEVITVVAAALTVNDEILFVRRPLTSTHFAGHYEIPGGKVNRDESNYNALVRELREEIDIEISSMKEPTFNTQLSIGTSIIQFIVYQFSSLDWRGQVRCLEGQPDIQWLSVSSVLLLQLTPGTRAWCEWIVDEI